MARRKLDIWGGARRDHIVQRDNTTTSGPTIRTRRDDSSAAERFRQWHFCAPSPTLGYSSKPGVEPTCRPQVRRRSPQPVGRPLLVQPNPLGTEQFPSRHYELVVGYGSWPIAVPGSVMGVGSCPGCA